MILKSTNNNESYNCKLDSCLFFSTAKLAREFSKIAEEAFGKTGLSTSHALILYLVNQEEELHQKEIGEKLHLTPSTITRFIEKLVRKKLVTKRTEGKNVFICSTEEGLLLQNEIISSWNRLNDTYKDILTEEEALQFITISSKLIEKLQKQDN
jgi:DNA-binding MarR family transcriptional regulator